MARLQVNVASGNDGISPFLNWAKARQSSSSFIGLRVSGSEVVGADLSPTYVDSDFELDVITNADRFRQMIYLASTSLTGNYPDFDGLAMTVKWDGQAVTGITGLNITNISEDLGNNTATFQLATGSGASNIGIYFALDENQGDGSPPTNIRIYETAKAAALESGKIMDPDWKTYYSRFAVLRFLDAMGINTTSAHSTTAYTDIPTTDFAYWGGATTGSDGFKTGWPIAALIEIANDTDSPIVTGKRE